MHSLTKFICWFIFLSCLTVVCGSVFVTMQKSCRMSQPPVALPEQPEAIGLKTPIELTYKFQEMGELGASYEDGHSFLEFEAGFVLSSMVVFEQEYDLLGRYGDPTSFDTIHPYATMLCIPQHTANAFLDLEGWRIFSVGDETYLQYSGIVDVATAVATIKKL